MLPPHFIIVASLFLSFEPPAGHLRLSQRGRLMERAMLPQIETPRLVLRELCPDDALALQAFQTRPSYLRCQAMEPDDFKDGVERVTRYMQYRGEGERRRLYDFVARLDHHGQVVGHAGLARSAPGIASLGLGIDEAYARRGLATEIALRL